MMAYPYVCDNCLDEKHDECEEARDTPPKAKPGEEQIIGGGFCICSHGEYPSSFELSRREMSKKARELRKHERTN